MSRSERGGIEVVLGRKKWPKKRYEVFVRDVRERIVVYDSSGVGVV